MTGSPPPVRDPADALAEAERMMTMHRIRQSAETVHVVHDRRALRPVAVAGAALFAACPGALMGALRGHALPVALAMAVVGGLLALIATRER